MKSIEQLRSIHKAILGANVGFLLFFVFYLIEKKVPISFAILAWALTTGIVIGEWCFQDEYFEDCSSIPVIGMILIIVYMGTLLFLPISLLIPLFIAETKDLTLRYYVYSIMALCSLDAILSFLVTFEGKSPTIKKRLIAYGIFDIILLPYYFLYIFLIDHTPLPLQIKLLIIGGFYLLEVMGTCIVKYFYPNPDKLVLKTQG